MTSSGRRGCQARWRLASKETGLEEKLRAYFELLRRDSRKARSPFHGEYERQGSHWEYRWTAATAGRGALLYDPQSRRVVFLEVTGSKKDALLPDLRTVLSSFEPSLERGLERWSVLGLRARLPVGMRVVRRQFLAGKTSLSFQGRSLRVHAHRWGLAEQLIARHGIEGWSRAALAIGDTPVTGTQFGLEFAAKRRAFSPTRRKVMVAADPVRNQILTLDVRYGARAPEPTWEWLCF